MYAAPAEGVAGVERFGGTVPAIKGPELAVWTVQSGASEPENCYGSP